MNEWEIDEDIPQKSRWPFSVFVIIDIRDILYSGDIVFNYYEG